jgi:hypothetical protein
VWPPVPVISQLKRAVALYKGKEVLIGADTSICDASAVSDLPWGADASPSYSSGASCCIIARPERLRSHPL